MFSNVSGPLKQAPVLFLAKKQIGSMRCTEYRTLYGEINKRHLLMINLVFNLWIDLISVSLNAVGIGFTSG